VAAATGAGAGAGRATGAGAGAGRAGSTAGAGAASGSGVGKKTAERIILELKDKIEVDRHLPDGADAGIERTIIEEAVSALAGLGLSRVNAEKALERLDLDTLGDSPKVEDLVREALKKVSSKS